MSRLLAAWEAFKNPDHLNPPTPVTISGAEAYDHLPAIEAVIRAWTEPGENPDWHRHKRRQVHAAMPPFRSGFEQDNF